jgi:L-lactate utilization protein LutB
MKKKTPYHQLQPDATDPAQCNGCGVCMLSCPIWNQHHTKMLTSCGRNRASIGGAVDEDLLASARACLLCGSCEALCPMGIRTQQTTIALRRTLAARGLLPKPGEQINRQKSETPAVSRILLPGKALGVDSKLASSVLALLGDPVGLHVDADTILPLPLNRARRSAISASRHSYCP